MYETSTTDIQQWLKSLAAYDFVARNDSTSLYDGENEVHARTQQGRNSRSLPLTEPFGVIGHNVMFLSLLRSKWTKRRYNILCVVSFILDQLSTDTAINVRSALVANYSDFML